MNNRERNTDNTSTMYAVCNATIFLYQKRKKIIYKYSNAKYVNRFFAIHAIQLKVLTAISAKMKKRLL